MDVSFDRGWILLDHNNKIRGFFGNIPQLYQYFSTELLFFAASSWVVEEEYKQHAINLLNEYFFAYNTSLLTQLTGHLKII